MQSTGRAWFLALFLFHEETHMEKKLYLVCSTRLVLAATETEARRLAGLATQRSEEGCIQVIVDLYDLPVGWENTVPLGSPQASAYQILLLQFATDPRFQGFGLAVDQADLVERWLVSAQLTTGERIALSDFATLAQARTFLADLEKAAFAAQLQRLEQSEDGHLESLYEDRVSGGNYEDF
jgi:hypothetical protein